MSGRKTKLTKELMKEAERLLLAGNYDVTVCDYLGIHPSTWYRWLQDGEGARSGLKKEFYDMVKKSQSTAEMRAVTGILQAGQDNWTALAWFLERRYKDKWKKDGRVEIEGNITNKNIDLSNLSIQELEKLANLDIGEDDEEDY